MHLTRLASRRILILLVLAGGFLRLLHVVWDEGHHLHPDERFISMVEERLEFPKSPLGYFDSAHSPLNPYNRGHDSFVYGTLPIFLTKAVATVLKASGYGRAYIIGRILSAFFDLVTVWITYLLARRFAGRATALGAAALLAFCPLGIQLSHFWATDTFLTTFATLTVLGSVRLALGRSTLLEDGATGLALGLAVACKVTALALFAPVGVAILVRLARPGARASGLPGAIGNAALRSAAVLAGMLVAVRVGLPYAFSGLGFDPRYLKDMKGLISLSGSVAGYPPALQWAGRTVLFPLYNFVFWGAAPFFGITALIALVWCLFAAWKGERRALLVPLSYAVFVAAYHGLTLVKSIRYFYPAYPIFAVLSAVFLGALVRRFPDLRAVKWLAAAVVAGTVLAGIAFSSIYWRPVTRLEASRWIYAHVPPPARISGETWDDGVPYSFPGHDNAPYAGPPMELWGPDNTLKVETILKTLARADWVAVTSGRVYSNITRIPIVFPATTAYYRALFEGRLGFERAAEFTSYPSLGPLRFPDDRAEEQFTVYDHPRVLLFRKTKNYSESRARSILLAAMPKTPPTIWDWEKWPRANRKVTEPVRPSHRVDIEKASAPLVASSIPSLPAALLFYLAALAVGAAAFPITWALFPRFPDRGAGFARILGLVAATYIYSIAVHWRLLGNGRGGSLVVLFLLAAASLAIFLARRGEILAFVRERRRLLVHGEIVFAAGFLLFAGLRALNPEIYWGEKPMDFSILNILVRTPTLPASDPWFAGAPLGYYTFGQEMIAYLTIVTGLSTALTFNLAFGWIGGATLQGAFTLARNWTGTGKAAAASAVFVGILGNLSGLREWLIAQPMRGEGRHFDWNYFWATSRVIKDTINEYPFWSLTFADLHAHVLALPVLLLVLAAALACVRANEDTASSALSRLPAGIVLGFAGATEALTNAWDAPLLAGIFLLTFLVCAFEPGRFSLPETIRAVPAFAAAGISALLFALPLWIRGGGPPGYGRNGEAGARGVDILTVFGFFFTLAFAWWLVAAYRRLLESGWKKPIALGVLSALAIVLAAVALFVPDIFLAAGVLLFVLAAILLARTREERLALGMTAAGFGLVLFAQRYYIYDRMNTYFKLYFETWAILAVATAVLVFRPAVFAGSFPGWRKPLRAVAGLLFLAALFTSATAGFGAIWRGRPMFADPGPRRPSLDGLAYRGRAHPGEFRAILWMRKNIRGTAVILEAQGPSYQEFSRISMLTGLPTVLGWEYHVQQRGNPPDEIAARREAIRFIYTSPKSEPIEKLLRRYHVGYVYVGWLERKTYPSEGLRKFDTSKDLFQVVYENPEARIYRVIGGDTQDVIQPAKENLPPQAEEAKAPTSKDEPEEKPVIREAPEEERPPFSGMREPRDAAVDDKGRVWVTDFGQSRLRIFNADGGLLGGWGGRGEGTYNLREPCGVAVRGDHLYVADTWNGRIQYYTITGEYKATASGLYGPRGVAVAPGGKVWAADTGNNRLMLYGAELENGRPIGKKGSGPGEFLGPVGIAVGPSGSVYVADAGNRRVEILDPDGQFVKSLPISGWADGVEPHVEVDADGTVYVAVPPADAVQVYDPAGTPTLRWTADASGQKFARPTGLALDQKNRMLYVVNSGNNTVSKVPLPKRKEK